MYMIKKFINVLKSDNRYVQHCKLTFVNKLSVNAAGLSMGLNSGLVPPIKCHLPYSNSTMETDNIVILIHGFMRFL